MFTKEKYIALKERLFASKNSFTNSRFIKTFISKHPRIYAFIIERFSLDFFVGLPLTVLIACFVANLILLNDLVEAFLNNPLIVSTDQLFAKFMYSIRIHWVAEVFYYFSLLGSFWGVVSIAFISILLFIFTKHKNYILPVLISLFGTQLSLIKSKMYFHRIRPIEYSFYTEHSFSYPSGHATISVAFYGVLFYAIIRSRVSISSNFRWMIAAVFFIGLLGFSRLYMCVHYLSDVLTGYSLGFLWWLLAVSISEWILHRNKMKQTTTLP